ncbi:MAG: c-type cytochrome biogenesis protein CcsB [Cellulomonadaceae bacterium]
MTIGEISDVLVWGAATAYTIAMVCFALDMARRSDELATRRAGVSAQEADGAGARPAVALANDPGTDAGRRTKALGIAMSTSWAGLAIHLAAIVCRGLAAGRTPWANMYEFTMVGTFVAMAVFLVVQLRRDVRFLGLIVSGMVVMALVVALNAFHIEADGVQPALQKYWIVIHVGVAIGATGVFTVGFAVAVLQLLRDSRFGGSPLLHGQGVVVRGRTLLRTSKLDWRWLDTLPGTTALESLSFRFNAVGFVLWTFTLISGGIWAEEAWGRYWNWDPKEVWTFVVWVIYAAYLHARTTRGWSGRRAAWFVVVGYACVLFNFTGVNMFFDGKHSYSQL